MIATLRSFSSGVSCTQKHQGLQKINRSVFYPKGWKSNELRRLLNIGTPSSTCFAHFCLRLKLPRTCPYALYFDIMNVLDYIWKNAVFVPNNQDWTLSFGCQWPRPLSSTLAANRRCQVCGPGDKIAQAGDLTLRSPNNNSILGGYLWMTEKHGKNVTNNSPRLPALTLPSWDYYSPCLCVNLHRPAYADTRCKDARMAQNLPITSPGSVRNCHKSRHFPSKRMPRLEFYLNHLSNSIADTTVTSFLFGPESCAMVPFQLSVILHKCNKSMGWGWWCFCLNHSRVKLVSFPRRLTQDTCSLADLGFVLHAPDATSSERLEASHRATFGPPWQMCWKFRVQKHSTLKQIQRS